MTTESKDNPNAPGDEPSFLERLRSAIALLESIHGDRGQLATVPAEDRHRLMQAARHVFEPDANARRRLVRATRRHRRVAKVREEESVLSSTGIRELRRKPVFTTPNFFLPAGFESAEDDRKTEDARHCY